MEFTILIPERKNDVLIIFHAPMTSEMTIRYLYRSQTLERNPYFACLPF